MRTICVRWFNQLGNSSTKTRLCHVVTRALTAKEMLPCLRESVETESGKIRNTNAHKRWDKFKDSEKKTESRFFHQTDVVNFDIPSDVAAHRKDEPALKFWCGKVTDVVSCEPTFVA